MQRRGGRGYGHAATYKARALMLTGASHARRGAPAALGRPSASVFLLGGSPRGFLTLLCTDHKRQQACTWDILRIAAAAACVCPRHGHRWNKRQRQLD